MAQFLAKPLASLEAIYRFVAGRSATSDVELGGGIQLVHDVSREAEHGASQLFTLSHTVVTAGTGTLAFIEIPIEDLFDGTITGIRNQLRALGRTVVNTDVYYMDGWVVGNGTDFSFATIAVRGPNNGRNARVAGTAAIRIIRFANLNFGIPAVASGANFYLGVFNSNNKSAGELSATRLPIQVDSIFNNVNDDGTGATTITFNHVLAFVPQGAPPPLWA